MSKPVVEIGVTDAEGKLKWIPIGSCVHEWQLQPIGNPKAKLYEEVCIHCGIWKRYASSCVGLSGGSK